MTLVSERWLDEIVLLGVKSDIDAAQNDIWFAPLGIGDLAIMSLQVRVQTVDVLSTTVRLGVEAYVVTKGGGNPVVDLLGCEPFNVVENTTNSLSVAAYIDPSALALFRQTEGILVTFGEIDTDATPTADLRIRVKCVRIPARQEPGAPLQLVR